MDHKKKLKKVSKILKDYQRVHCENLALKLYTNFVCFDASETGIGKTYCAIATAILLKKKIFILCPRTIVSFWKKIAQDVFDEELLCISTYNLIIKGKSIKSTTGESEKCPYLDIDESASVRYKWKLPEDTMIIFDEVHKCGNYGSYASEVLMSFKNVYNEKYYVLLISASICENPSKFRLFSIFLKWFDSYHSVPNWLQPKYNPTSASITISKNLASKNLITRVKISDLGDAFQKNQVIAEYYDVDKNIANKIDKLHTSIQNSLNDLHDKQNNDKKCGFIIGLRERQEIELLKVSIFVDLVEQYLENNFSVIIFVNFLETLKILAKELKTDCICYGEQTIATREKNIANFMEDKNRVILCTMGTGGESISLNDKNGKYRRVSLISPQWSSLKLVQACGRNSRVDSKTPSLNIIVYANSLAEKRMCNKIKDKCSLYTQITDLDLSYEE